MRCPICKKDVRMEGNPYRPFCSERCKMIDLDNWLSDRYRLPASVSVGESQDQPSPKGDEAKVD